MSRIAFILASMTAENSVKEHPGRTLQEMLLAGDIICKDDRISAMSVVK